jgi:hypothetical protein
MEIIHVDGEVLLVWNFVFQLEDVQLQIAAAQIFGLEAEIVAGDGLHAEHGLVEFYRLREIFGADRQMVEAGNLHHAPPSKAKCAGSRRNLLDRSKPVDDCLSPDH